MIARDIYKCERRLGYLEAAKRKASQEKERQWEEKAGREASRRMELLGEGPNGFPYMVGDVLPPQEPSVCYIFNLEIEQNSKTTGRCFLNLFFSRRRCF